MTFSRLCRGFKGSEVKRRFTVVRPLFDIVFERQKRGILAAWFQQCLLVLRLLEAEYIFNNTPVFGEVS